MAKIIRVEDGVYYYDKLPAWVRKKYFDAIFGKCQLCKKKMEFKDMEVHRVKRGHKGGLYTVCPINHKGQNCMMVHTKCHRELHGGEPLRR